MSLAWEALQRRGEAGFTSRNRFCLMYAFPTPTSSIRVSILVSSAPEALAPFGKETLVGDRGDCAVVQLSPRTLGSYCRQVKSFAALPDLASKYWQSIRS